MTKGVVTKCKELGEININLLVNGKRKIQKLEYVSDTYLNQAGWIVMNKRFPFASNVENTVYQQPIAINHAYTYILNILVCY